MLIQSRVGRAQDFADRYRSSQDGWRIVAFPYGRRLPYSKFNRLEESYGEDGYLSAVMGTALSRVFSRATSRREWELALNTIWDMVVAVMLMRRR